MKLQFKPDTFDNFVDAICILGEDLRPVYFNSSFASLIKETSLAAIRKRKINEIIQLESFDWNELAAAFQQEVESSLRELEFSSRHSRGRIQMMWITVLDEKGLLKVLLYLRDVSLEENLNKKYHEELVKKEETIRVLDQHLFQISLIRDVLERMSAFDDPLVMLRNLFNHLSGILHLDIALYLKQEEVGGMPVLLVHSEQVDMPGKEVRSVAELLKPYLIDNDLYQKKVFGYQWISFRYLDDSDRQKYFVFGKKGEFTLEQGNVLETISEPLSFSMDSRELFKKAMTDELTDLYNHRYFKVRLENELREHAERKKMLGLLLLDIDFFKKVNDTYGHLVGDAVLKAAAHCLKNFCRSTDIPARYGGEEFAVILPDVEEANLLQIGERLRDTIENLVIPVEGLKEPLRITASIGLSVAPKHGRSPMDLIGKADEALYEAKRSGRNRALLNRKVA